MGNNQIDMRKLWLIIALLSLGYGVGGGLSNYSDHGSTVPVLMQIGGGLLMSIIGFIQGLKKK